MGKPLQALVAWRETCATGRRPWSANATTKRCGRRWLAFAWSFRGAWVLRHDCSHPSGCPFDPEDVQRLKREVVDRLSARGFPMKREQRDRDDDPT